MASAREAASLMSEVDQWFAGACLPWHHFVWGHLAFPGFFLHVVCGPRALKVDLKPT